MRVKVSLLALAVLLIAAVAIPAGSTAAGTKVAAKTSCKGNYTSLTPTKLKGVDFGTVSCKGFFGKGVQTVNYTEAISKSGVITAGGPTKVYGDLGTMHGSFHLSGKAPTTGTTIALTGAGKISGGTGVYKGAKGTISKLKCTTTNAGNTYSCTFTVTLTKL